MAEKSGKLGRTAVWILLALLLLGLGGFGATNFSGTVRSIGSVGETEIPVTDYARSLQNEIRAAESQQGGAISFQQAQAMGLPTQVLGQLVVRAALENEADRLGISIGDERLAQDLREIGAFQGPNGSFDREAYRLTLENVNLSEREFEEQLRNESAATILQGAVLAGVKMPDSYLDTLIAYTGERRAFTWAELDADGLQTGLPEPSEEELRAFYEENIDDYTRPRTKQITYAWLTPEMLVDSVEVDEDTLRAAYEEREAEFNMPERRLAERLVFADTEAAEAAMARITSGEASFEDLVAERDLELADVDMGDVTRGDLGAAADTVFAAGVGDVVGPAQSDLGPALFRVNAVLPAQETSFEDAVPDLRGTLALDRARRVIETQAQSYDDELAGGVTLEELAETTDMELDQIGWTESAASGIAGYEAFREAAEAVSAEDYPAIDQLGDGGVFALRLDEVQEAAPYPFEDVRETVGTDWETKARQDALVAEAEALSRELAEGRTFEGLGLTPQSESGLTRTAFGADVPAAVLQKVFEMEPDATAALPADGTAVLVRLDEILPADPDDERAQQLSQLFGNQAAQDVAQDLFRALAADIQSRAGLSIDQQAINAVHANFQ